MNARSTSFSVSWGALPVVVRREGRTLLDSRFVQVFAFVAVGGSVALAFFSPGAALPFALLLFWLYVVPLFGLLIGVSAAHEDLEERPFLMSQPVGRFTFGAGKFAALVVSLALVLAAALVPAAFAVSSIGPLLMVGALGLALALVFGSGGLAIGCATASRTRGLIAALLAWIGALVLYDLAALALSGLSFVKDRPAFWAGLLLLNPIDAARLTGLLALGDVPFTVPGEGAWIERMATWLPAWTGLLTLAWTGGLLWSARRSVERRDV